MDTCVENNNKFTMAYAQYRSLVYRTTCNNVRCIYDADDICQDLFFDLYKKIDTIRDIQAWISVAIRYQILMFYRKNNFKFEDLVDMNEIEKLTAPDVPLNERLIIDDLMQNHDIFYDDFDKETFRLVCIENRTYDETSDQIDLSPRQIRYRYTQLMSRMLNHLKKRGIRSLNDIL